MRFWRLLKDNIQYDSNTYTYSQNNNGSGFNSFQGQVWRFLISVLDALIRWSFEYHFFMKTSKFDGDIDVGDGWWRQNMLMTSLSCW